MNQGLDYLLKRLKQLRSNPFWLPHTPLDPRDPSYDAAAATRYMRMQGLKSRMLQAMNRRKGGGVQ